MSVELNFAKDRTEAGGGGGNEYTGINRLGLRRISGIQTWCKSCLCLAFPVCKMGIITT